MEPSFHGPGGADAPGGLASALRPDHLPAPVERADAPLLDEFRLTTARSLDGGRYVKGWLNPEDIAIWDGTSGYSHHLTPAP